MRKCTSIYRVHCKFSICTPSPSLFTDLSMDITCDELKAQHDRMLNKPLPPSRVFLRDEVSLHNHPTDAWVIVNGRVLDLSPFLAQPDILMNPVSLAFVIASQPNPRPKFKRNSICLAQPLEELLAYAGKDISHHFAPDGTPLTRISGLGSVLPTLAATNEATMYKNSGKQSRPSNNAEDAAARNRVHWWQTGAPWEIGRITSDERRLRVFNTLSSKTSLVVYDYENYF